jgi:hypothetical protein
LIGDGTEEIKIEGRFKDLRQTYTRPELPDEDKKQNDKL